MANLKITKDWLRLANTDLIGSKALLELGENFYALLAFHAQQAAEKSLKAYLVFNSIRVPKTHDLSDLLALIELKNLDFARSLKQTTILTDYAVAYRYPDATKEQLTKSTVLEAIALADFTLSEVLKKLGPV